MKVFPDYLPPEFGVLLLTLALILVIAPYAAGHDFGKIKIPDFGNSSKKALRLIGPVALLFSVALHLPLIPKQCYEPILEEVTDESVCGFVEEEYIISAEKAKTCRRPEFGVERWQNTETTSGNSGWRGGGTSQPDWCSALTASFIKGRSIGSNHTSKVVSSSESARWTGLLKNIREYNYSCKVEIQWNPIYKAKQDGQVCGVEPAVVGKRKKPATCKVKTGMREVECDA